ncbi:MAG: biotin transporter BioY [Acidobacteria bacterium]|nr:biotin transporter BioY [Acidobacteriota bacterium]
MLITESLRATGVSAVCPPLVTTWTRSGEYGRLIRMAAMLFCAGLIAATAQISIPLPLTPVPLTLQPTIVLLTAAVLGARLGATCLLLYLAAGVAGLPVFAWSPWLAPGMGRLLGPTGGYLLAYPVAAYLVGWLAQRGLDRRYITAVGAMLAGLAVIYLGGVAWLLLLGAPSGTPQAAAELGVYPFLLADVVKLALVAAFLPSLRRFTTSS